MDKKKITQQINKMDKIETKLDDFNEQLDTKTSKEETKNIQQQVNNLVLGAVGDGNNAEVVQARGNYDTLHGRISDIEKCKADVSDVIANKYADVFENVSAEVLQANKSCTLNENGELVDLDGENWWCVSDYIELPKKGYIEISGASNNTNKVCLVEYDFAKNIISTTKPNLESSPFAVLQNKRISGENSNTCYVRILGNFHSSQNYRRESMCKIFKKSLTDYVNENIFIESTTHLLTTNLYADRDTLEYNTGKRLDTDGSLKNDAGWETSNFIKVDNDIEVTGFSYGTERPVIALYDTNKVMKKIYNGVDRVSHNSSFYKRTIKLSLKDCAYVRTVSSKKYSLLATAERYLNNAETIAKIYNTELFLYDKFDNNDIFVTNEKNRLNEDGTLKTDTDWETSDFIEVNEPLKVVGNAYGTERVAIALYNNEKKCIKYYYADTLVNGNFYKKEIIIEPSQCRYVRLVSSKKYNLKSSAKFDKNILDTIKELKSSGSSSKLDYTSDTIYFTVKVNQNFANNRDITTNMQDNEVLKPVSCALRLPPNYSSDGKPTKIAVVMHGAGGKVTSSSAGEMNGFVDLLNNGYAIFDVNGSNNDYTSHSDHMGGQRVLSAYLKAFDWIKAHYNVEDKLYVHGHSMGGLTALNFAIQNPSICKVLGLYHPVVDLYNQAWKKPWFGGADGTKFAIAREYNFDDKTGNTFEKDKVVGFNPIENNSILIGDKRYNSFPCPVKIWHGNADTTVLLSGSQGLIEAYKNAGVRCELRVLTGVAHIHTDAMYKELTIWFNRF